MSKITLECVKDKSKLRIRFHSFTDDEGKVYTNVYDNSFNCKFPRSIREEGRFYEIGPEDLSIAAGRGKPFYNVKFNDIKIVNADAVAMKPHSAAVSRKRKAPSAATETDAVIFDVASMKIFEVTECVICISCEPTEVLIPCAHKCLCKDCYVSLAKTKSGCPLCRRNITATISM